MWQEWGKTQKGRPRYLFPTDGKHPHVQADNLAERFRRVEIEGFTPKVCRATVRTCLQRLGCPTEVRSRISHHQKSDRIQRAYDHYSYDDEAKLWWQSLGKHIEKLLENG